MIGTTLSHYRITGAIGAGGMGEVYRATDTRLGRDVALKVLPATVAEDPERLDRFQREAKALAALDHPGIVTVYSVEEADGVHFLTMQLVEGEPLHRAISGRGLPLDRWLSIASGIAEALAVAHDKGIVHRDLKPANIMVTPEGRVKILDFGLAKMADPSSGDTRDPNLSTVALTQEGVVMGTVPYMSPEQVRGQRLDARSDLFSLGAILYEMASGRRPFRAENSADLMSAIVRDAPEPISAVRDDFPPAIERVVKRAMTKDPARRFQTARGLLAELLELKDEIDSGSMRAPVGRVSGQVPTPVTEPVAADRFWIAVLPFGFRGAGPGLESLAEGIGEEIVTGLSRFSYLRVIARSSTLRYAGEAVDVRAVGRELGARYVMEGNVRQTGERVRIATQLVDAVTGAHLWAEKYDRRFTPDAVFDLQDDVVPKIVSTIADPSGVLPHAMSETLRGKDPDSLTPHETVLRSFGYRERLDAEEHAEVRAALERTVREQPGDADGWAMLSDLFAEEFKHGFNVLPGSLDRALDAARRAVAAAPSNHLGYHMLAQALFFRRDLPAFRTAAERAIALNPMDGCTIAYMGILLAYADEWERGCELTERAMQLNPHHPGWYRFALFNDAYRRHDYRGAVDVALQFNMPSYFYTHMALAASYGQLGEREGAARALAELLALKPDFAAVARHETGKWWGEGELREELLDGLRKAGLEIGPAEAEEARATASTGSEASISGGSRRQVEHRPRRPPLVGRDDERSRLDRLLDEAVGGRGGLVLLGGEPGVGKTRLASEILEDGRERGMLVLTGHAYEEEGVPYVTAVEILEEMVRILPASEVRELLGDSASEIARLVPGLRSTFPDIAEPLDLPPEQQRRFLFNNVLDVLSRASRHRPMALLLDDLHWADESSLLLLEHLVPHLPGLPVLMVGTCRDAEAEMGAPFKKTLARWVRQERVERFAIQRLSEDSVANLLAGIGGTDPPTALVAAIYRETEGNPFFVTEVARHLAEEGRLFDARGGWRSDLEGKELDVPAGVRLVVERRLERLGAEASHVLSLAAVIGRRFDLDLLEVAAVQGGGVVLEAVEEAASARLLTTVEAQRASRYEFAHELIRQTLLAAVSKPRRQRTHLRVAEALERLAGDRVEERAAEIAHHLTQAGGAADAGRTRHFLRMAARRAQAAAAADEAAAYLDRALAIDEELEPVESADMLFQRGLALRAMGRWTEAVADWDLALPVFESAGRTDLVSRICRDVAHQRVWINRIEQAKEMVARGLRAVGAEPTADRCRLLSILGYAHGLCGEFEEAESINDQAMAIAERVGDEQLLAGEVLLGRIYLYQHSLRAGPMGAVSDRAIELARRSGRPWDLSSVFGGALFAWMLQGRFDRMMRQDEEIRLLAEREGDVGNQFHRLVTRGILELSRGGLATALATLENANVVAREAGFPWTSIIDAVKAVIELQRGEWDAATVLSTEAMKQAVTGTWADAEAGFGLVVSAYCDPSAAARALEGIEARLPTAAPQHRAGSWILATGAVEAAAVLGRSSLAAGLYPVVRQWVEEGGVVLFSLGLAEKFAGIAAAAAREWTVAESHFEAALLQTNQLPHRVGGPEVRRWYARMLLDRDGRGDGERARTLLTEARAAYEEIGMPRHVEMIDTLLQRGRS